MNERLGAALILPRRFGFVPMLLEAAACPCKLRLYLRLARQWDWLSSGQYEHVSRIVAQVGRLLGGWIRQTASGRPGVSGREAEDFS
jgi:hypothetical protein